MIRGGIGGGNTKTGLIYEAKVDLTTFLNGQKGYVVKDMDIFYNEELVGNIFKKNDHQLTKCVRSGGKHSTNIFLSLKRNHQRKP